MTSSWTTITIRASTKELLEDIRRKYGLSFDEVVLAAAKLLRCADINPLAILAMSDEDVRALFREDVLRVLRNMNMQMLRHGKIVYVLMVPRLSESGSVARASTSTGSSLVESNPWVDIIRSRAQQRT